MSKSDDEGRQDDTSKKVWPAEALAFFAAPPAPFLIDSEIVVDRPLPIDDSGPGLFADESKPSSLPDPGVT